MCSVISAADVLGGALDAGAAGAVGVLEAAATAVSDAIAFTALWHAGERFERFCFRQFRAGAPPVGTVEQCAM